MTGFPKKLTPREQKILIVTVLLALVAVGYYGVWRPGLEKFLSLDEQIFAMQMKLRKAKIFLRQKDEILAEAKKYPNLAQMDAGKDEEEIARLLNLIEQTARRSGVSLSDVKPQQVQSDKVSKRFAVELHAESPLEQLVIFLHELQVSAELLKIEQVQTSPKEEQSQVLRSYLVVTRVVVK